MTLPDATEAVRRALGRHVAGYCYVASEAIYHLAGGKRAGLCPMVLGSKNGLGIGSHWFLVHKPSGELIDVTAGQFRPRLTREEYGLARGCGFLTKRPSSGAAAIIWAVRLDKRAQNRVKS